MTVDPRVRPSAAGIDVRRALLLALSIGGYLAGAYMYVLITGGDVLQTGIDLAAYVRAGEAVLTDGAVYAQPIGEVGAFAYAPPWAIAFGALAWAPPALLQATIVALDVLALRYVTGSWLATGWLLWVPLIPLVLAAGNVDLLIAAAIVMAWRGIGAPLAIFGMAKIAPFLGLPIPWQRQVVVALAVALVITLPWLGLWVDWIEYLMSQPTSIRISLPLGPWWLRLPIALLLLIPRRSYLSGLAVVVAMPSLYLSTLTILIAPLRLWLDARRDRSIAGPAASVAPVEAAGAG